VDSFSDYQFQIYREGAAGRKPAISFSYERLEGQARELLSDEGYGYAAGGAGSESTMRGNVAAFQRQRIVPRMLGGAGKRDLSCRVVGHALSAPVLLAPVGIQTILHKEGETATAAAAAELGLTLVQSTVGSYTLEQVAAANGDGSRWFQLYWPGDPDLADSFVQRAEASGYTAIVVTLDTLLLGWRPRDLDQGYLPFLLGQGIANYLSDPVFRAALAQPPEDDPAAAATHFTQVFSDPALSWDDLRQLRERTRLPLLVKGIQNPDDARRARDIGVDGVIVSNHGGRQVDGAIASLDALPGVAAAVGGDMTVLMDSGIRGGADVFKALALGAHATLVARPWLWGLAVGGRAGVVQTLRGILAELDLTMALSGVSSVDSIEASYLREV
jgi:lactate 2-monooxygenase